MGRNKNASAKATTTFFSKHTPPSPNTNNDMSNAQQTPRPAINNWTCSGHNGGPINLNAVANASNIIQAHVCAAGSECGDTILPLVSCYRCSGCEFAVHIICQVEFELNSLSLPYPSFTGICKPCATQLNFVKLVTRDDCDYPFLSFKSPHLHQISKNWWKPLQIQHSKEAMAKKKREAQARKSANATESTNATPAPTIERPTMQTTQTTKTKTPIINPKPRQRKTIPQTATPSALPWPKLFRLKKYTWT
jgi:hypothetical protein